MNNKNYIEYLRICNKENYIGLKYPEFLIEMAGIGYKHWKKEHREMEKRTKR